MFPVQTVKISSSVWTSRGRVRSSLYPPRRNQIVVRPSQRSMNGQPSLPQLFKACRPALRSRASVLVARSAATMADGMIVPGYAMGSVFS